MFLKIVVLSTLVALTSSMMLPRQLSQIIVQQQTPFPEPNYNYSYDVNDAKTGDIKNQSETRKGDAVVGQYSLVQPDGVRRLVEYKADDATGFTAKVKQEALPKEIESKDNMNQDENNNHRPVNIIVIPGASLSRNTSPIPITWSILRDLI